MSQMQIQQTSDYKKFKLHTKNRKLNQGKIKKLSLAMKKNNLLPIFPIIINEKYEILDGQHRLKAAEISKVPVSFIVSNGQYNISLVAETNSFQNGWTLADYIRYYAKSQRKSYVELLEVAEKYKVAPTLIANTSYDQSVAQEIKLGRFKFDHKDKIIKLLDYCLTFHTDHGFDFWKTRSFVRAINYICGVNGFNKMRLYQKITTHRNLLIRKATKEEYIESLQSIYNKNCAEEVRSI